MQKYATGFVYHFRRVFMKMKLSQLLIIALVLTSLVGFSVQSKPLDPSEKNMLSNEKFKTELSQAIPDDQGIVNTENNWIFFTNSGAEGTYEKYPFGAHITPTDVLGKPNYGIQLIQSPISLDSLGIYKVTINAKADAPRIITIKIGATGDKGWKAYTMKEIALTTKFKDYEFEFTLYGDADPAARFEIFFADDQSPVDIKRVSMAKVGEAEPVITMDDLLKRTKTEADEDAVETWELVWSDEFDGNVLDTSKWTAEIGNGADKGIPGWGNGELQYYTDSPQNIIVQDGKLIIRALKEQKNFTVNGQSYTTDYTSARLITDGKYSTAYGKIEARMKLPSGQGFWPAFWMLGQNINEVPWPACGEIDILEYIGSKATEANGTVHGPISGGPGINNKIDTGIDLSQDFHTYSIEWDADEVEFYIDDILYHIVNKDEVAIENGPEEWVYDHDHFLLLNFAVGGAWPGSPNESTLFPAQLEVDYVRVYKDTNPASIDGEEVIDCDYEKPLVTPGVEAFSNGDFTSGTDHWNAYFHYDAAGSFNVLNEEAVLNISNDGAEDYSVLLEQGAFKLDGTKTYKLSFDAKSTIPRSLITILDTSYYSRPFSKQEQLETEFKHFEYEIAGINEDITLKFLLGEHGDQIASPYDVVIDNVTFIENGSVDNTSDSGYRYDFDNNLIKDNAFSIWEGDQWSGPGAGTLTVDGKSFVADVTGVGVAYSPQVFQDGLLFENGNKYLVSFTASALETKTINVNIGRALDADPWWTAYAPTQTIVLTNEETTYNFIFNMNEATYDNGKIVFEMGTINGDSTLTQVSIKEINVVKLDSIIGTDNWNIWENDQWSGSGAGTLSVDGNKLLITVTGVGLPYSPQVYQDGIPFNNSSDYLVMFDAESVLPKTINVNVGKALDADPWWTGYAPTQTYVIQPQIKTYAFSFNMSDATYANGKLVFELGTINGDSTLTDVTIQNIGIYENARIMN